MKEILKLLCDEGVAPLDMLDDEDAQYLSRKNLGGIIKFSADTYELDTDLLKVYPTSSYGVIPSKCWHRLAIGILLQNKL
jgi:hypothetical protein